MSTFFRQLWNDENGQDLIARALLMTFFAAAGAGLLIILNGGINFVGAPGTSWISIALFSGSN